jgi:predicted PurR-regulated permease PerM
LIGSPQSFEAQIRRWIQSAGGEVTAAVLGVAAYVPNLILQLALTSLACFFFLVDGNRFVQWTGDKIPMDPDVRIKVVESFKNTAISVIWATLAAATAQSACMLVSYLVLGVPAAFLAAGATFIFAWIPLVGSTPVWAAAVLYLFFQGMTWKAILMVVFGVITGLVDNFVRPMVLKGRSKMHPLVSLVAIFGGISMFGIMGVFIGPILAAVLISLLQIWPDVGDRFGLLPPKKTQADQSIQLRLKTRKT